MNYVDILNRNLNPRPGGIHVVDLFAGCGGLSLGFEAAGFSVTGYEADFDCVSTYKKNLHGPCFHQYLVPGCEYPKADILIGGPPCQPFSVIGNQDGSRDNRDGFPVFIDAVKRLQPKLWMFENVRGMMYRNKAYLHTILEELASLGYVTDVRLLNASDYGVPQNRERVIAVGHSGGFKYPEKHGLKFTVGDAISDTMTSTPEGSRFLTPSMDEYIARYEAKSSCVNPRDLHPDRPARTLTCRNLAGATSDMQRVRLPDGRRRMLLIQEAKRLQSFPDWFEMQGSSDSILKQIGNAVPPLLAYELGQAVKKYVEDKDSKVPGFNRHLYIDGQGTMF